MTINILSKIFIILLLNIITYESFSYSSQNFSKKSENFEELTTTNYSTTAYFEDVSKDLFTDVVMDNNSNNGEPQQVINAQKLSSHLYSRGKMDECWKEAKCEPLEENTCLGVKLPYSHTSLALSNLPSQRATREALEYMTALQNLPYCWSVVQPLLCAILFPQCNESSVQLPSREMCAITRAPCRLFERENEWPEYLQCKEEFPSKCKTASRDFNFNISGQCSPPLISTSNENLWFDGIKGCAIQCADPMFTAEEHKDLEGFIEFFGGLCLACAAFTVLTYLIDWKCASKYPALIIFYINGCFLVASIGFMVQFNSNVRENVTCYADGTLRHSEPSSGGNWSCVAVFVCVYYFMIAAGMWFIILGYAWHKNFKSLAAGQCQQHLERKAAYFHLISWSIPLIFTIGISSSAEVKADSAVGICFLSPTVAVRVGALLVPITLIIGTGTVFLVGGLKTLVKMKLECSNIISDHANKKIVETIIRLGIFIVAVVVFLGITIYCHAYIFMHQEDWKKSLRNFILCSSKIKFDGSECVMASRPSVSLYKLHLMAFFGSGIIMASWCWTTNTLKAWQRFLRRVVGVGGEEPVKLTKHKVIAQAFAKRNDLNNAGRLSISLQSHHSDPLGLNFEMNSATSCDVSSLFAAAIPYLMTRRGAVSGSSAFIFRRNSLDSEYSISRRVSLESVMNNRHRHHRRHSLDSQMSFHVSDVERVAAMQTAARFGQRRRRRDWFLSLRKGRKGQGYDRRNSTSDDSNLGSMILPTCTLSTNDSLFTTMMKKLNLSNEEKSFSRLKKEAAHGFPLPSDSEEETRENTATSLHSFSRKYNGFKHKVNIGKHIKNGCDNVAKASVGVQTSLDSLVSYLPVTHNKACQVSTPLLQRATTNPTSSSPSGSLTSLSDTSKPVKETSFISVQTEKNTKSSRRSLSPLSIRKGDSAHCKSQKKRCLSENEKPHCVLDLEDASL